MTEFLARIDSLFLGRRSFDMMRQQKGNFFSDKSWYVFSQTLTSVPEQVHLIQDNLSQIVPKIKNQPGKDIWLFGGANLTTSFLNAGLIDELLLSVHPIILGGGTPLFQHLNGRMPLDLINVKNYSSGVVQLHYRKGGVK